MKRLSKIQKQNYVAKLNREVIRLCNEQAAATKTPLRPEH